MRKDDTGDEKTSLGDDGSNGYNVNLNHHELLRIRRLATYVVE
jgi:hypothetical protein